MQSRSSDVNDNQKQGMKGLFIASAVAVLLAGAPALAKDKAHAEKDGGKVVHCAGINSCKGQGSCSGADNSCKSQNECKGKGWLETKSEKECTQKGGHVVAMK
jgi:hypothetical protein